MIFETFRQKARLFFLIVVWVCAAVFGVANPLMAQETWPQWRGPQRDGTIDASPWPAKLDATRLQTSWQQAIGEGYAGPVVSRDRVFTVETQDKSREIVRAFDRSSGEQIWEKAWDGAMKVPFFAASNGSWVRSTPAFDGDCLYVAGMRDVLVCLAARDGAIKWRVDFVEQFGTPLPDFGFVCSPLVIGKIYLHQQNRRFSCLDPKTQQVLWTSKANFGQYWSLVANGNTILALDQEGELLLIDADPKAFQLLDRRKITKQDTWAHVAVAGDHVFVRELKAITAYRWQEPAAVSLDQ